MIFIRLVDGGQNYNNRFEAVFRNVSREKWHTFFNANDIPRDLFPKDDLIDGNVIEKPDQTNQPDDTKIDDDIEDVEKPDDTNDYDDVETRADTTKDIALNMAMTFSTPIHYHIFPILTTVLPTMLCL